MIRVHVAYADASSEVVVALDLPDGATVADAVCAPSVVERIPREADTSECAIFGRRVPHEARLADGDRVEITRALASDPRHARRARAAAVRARRARAGRG
jgi:uncharacterized protein